MPEINELQKEEVKRPLDSPTNFRIYLDQVQSIREVQHQMNSQQLVEQKKLLTHSDVLRHLIDIGLKVERKNNGS